MNKHTRSIIVFSIVPTILILALLLVGSHLFNSSLEIQKAAKKKAYQQNQENKQQIAMLNEFLDKDMRREKMAYWDSHLNGDLLQTLSTNLATILSGFDESEIQNTAVSRPEGNSQIASQTENKFSRVNLVFEGHFAAIRRTVAELEFRMPQISLESLNVKPIQAMSKTEATPKLKVELNYVCWHKPDNS